MKFDSIIKNRYSVRKYQNIKVEEQVISEIAECGRLAPSAGCENPVIVYNLNEEQMLKLKEATKYTFKTKNMLLVCYDNTVSYKRNNDNLDFGIQDAAIVTTHMILKITELGLGSCWVGDFDSNKLKIILSLDQNIIPVVLLPFGYIDEKNVPSKWHYDRKTMDEFLRKI